MAVFDPQLTHWAYPMAVVALAAGSLVVALLGALLLWALARARRPPPCDEQGTAPTQG